MLNFLLSLILAVSTAHADVHVKAYYRKDGTFVRAHTRSDPGTASRSTYESGSLDFPTSGICYTPTYIDSPPVVKEEFDSCAMNTVHNHKLDQKMGKPPKECNGYTFNVVHTENFNSQHSNDFLEDKWDRFDKHCKKVIISNPPNDATHVCSYPSYDRGWGYIFIKVEKVTAQMPEKICN